MKTVDCKLYYKANQKIIKKKSKFIYIRILAKLLAIIIQEGLDQKGIR